MDGYLDDASRSADALRAGVYHTGDVAQRDADGYITYVGRADDVFKASDYRISPFELESVLIEHPAVAEAAVVPSPDPLRLASPRRSSSPPTVSALGRDRPVHLEFARTTSRPTSASAA
jgi:acetyl-CoA synthetase